MTTGYGANFCLTLFTNDAELAARAAAAGVERIGTDLERIGKDAARAGSIPGYPTTPSMI